MSEEMKQNLEEQETQMFSNNSSQQNDVEEEIKEIIIEETKKQEKIDKNKKVKNYKNVSIPQCLATIFFSLFAACSILIPFTFGNAGIHYTFEYLFTGNPLLPESVSNGTLALFALDASMAPTISTILGYNGLIFVGILAFNILASLLIIIIRSEILRLICKILSVIFGFAMIVLLASALIYIAGFAGTFIMALQPIDNLMVELESSGIDVICV